MHFSFVFYNLKVCEFVTDVVFRYIIEFLHIQFSSSSNTRRLKRGWWWWWQWRWQWWRRWWRRRWQQWRWSGPRAPALASLPMVFPAVKLINIPTGLPQGDDGDASDHDHDDDIKCPQRRRSAKYSQHYGCRKPDAKVVIIILTPIQW